MHFAQMNTHHPCGPKISADVNGERGPPLVSMGAERSADPRARTPMAPAEISLIEDNLKKIINGRQPRRHANGRHYKFLPNGRRSQISCKQPHFFFFK